MTRTAYLAALRAAIEAKNLPWTLEPSKRFPEMTGLDGFMRLAGETLETDRNVVAIDSPSFVEAWKAIGGKGKPTYRGLRALPA